MTVEGTVLMSSSRVRVDGHGMGMQREVWIHSIGRTSGHVDGREVNGKEKQESDRIIELF